MSRPHSEKMAPPLADKQSSANHRLEFRLLLESCCTVTSSVAEDRIRNFLTQPIDWAFFIRTAHYHRVVPLLYQTLKRVAPDAIPEAVLMSLRRRFQLNAQRNLFLLAELLQVLDLFDQNGVSAIPYKGPILATALYGDVALRQFSDLDLIVRASEVQLAKTLLMSRGYRATTAITEDEVRRLIRNGKDLIFAHADGVTLELHWGITADPDPIRIKPDFLWNNLRTLPIGGRLVNTHAPEDLLLILCVHGAKHRWEYLIWLCDVAELIRSYPLLNWAQMIDNASRLRAERILLLGVVLARNLLGAQLPENVNRTIDNDLALTELADNVARWITGEAPLPLEPGENQRYYMKLREHRVDRFLVALTQVRYYLGLTARDKEVLPQSAPMLLYLIRPFRLAFDYGLRPFQRFFTALVESWRK